MSGEPSSDSRDGDGRGAGRSSKRQIVCFLAPMENRAARLYAQENGLTRQALLGRAINRFLVSLGERPRLNDVVTRMVCMTNPRIRTFHNPYGRFGKSALAGWFVEAAVQDAAKALMRHGSNFQQAAVAGLDLLGVSAATVPGDPYAMDSHREEGVDSDGVIPEAVQSGAIRMPDLSCMDNDFPDF